MENLISLVNKLQRACAALGDHGEESALPTLWDSLPAIAVVGGQVLVFPSLARVLGWFLSDLVLPPQLRGADLAGCWWNREDELWMRVGARWICDCSEIRKQISVACKFESGVVLMRTAAHLIA